MLHTLADVLAQTPAPSPGPHAGTLSTAAIRRVFLVFAGLLIVYLIYLRIRRG